ncbi:MAG: universal stress protein [Halorhabdus sp.]
MGTEILLPTDGTEQAIERIERALDLASDKDASVHALYVVDTQRYGEPALSSVEVLIDNFEDKGRDHLASLVAQGQRKGVHIEGQCRHGDPAEEIVEAADELAVDLVVPCLVQVTPRQLLRKGLDRDRITDVASPMTA